MRTFKTSLERQIAEAVRIQRRGNVLNRRGEYNRCNITRLVLDTNWEQKKWDQAWEDKAETESVSDIEGGTFELGESRKTKFRGMQSPRNSKKIKIENEDGAVWGEEVGPEVKAKLDFLSLGVLEPLKSDRTSKTWKQSKLQTISGVEWLIHQLVREVVIQSVEIGEDLIIAKIMPEWEDLIQDEELSGLEALLEYDREDKLQAERESKIKKNKNKNLSSSSLVVAPKKKRGKKTKVANISPGQKTLDSYVVRGGVSLPVVGISSGGGGAGGAEKLAWEAEELAWEGVSYTELEEQYEEYFRNIGEKQVLDEGVRVKARTTDEVDRMGDRRSGKDLTGGGEGLENSDSLLVRTQSFQQVFEVGECTHFTGPPMPVLKRVGGVNVTPKRKYSELENRGFGHVLKPSQSYFETELIASESPSKRIKKKIVRLGPKLSL